MDLPGPKSDFSTMEPTSLRRWWFALLTFAAILPLFLIGRHGLWNNEFITLRVLDATYAEITPERLSVNHMPLYFLMEKAWTDAFGRSEASLRAIGAIFGWLAVWAVGRLGRRIGGYRLAVPVVASAAIHQLWLASSLDARMYSILVWAAAESTDAWFAWVRSSTSGETRKARNALIRWTLVSVFAIHVHLLYAGVLVLQVVDAGIRRVRQGVRIGAFGWAALAGTLLCIPITLAWVVNQNKFGGSSEFEFRTPGVLLRQSLRLYWGDYDAVDVLLPEVSAYLLFLVAVSGLIALLRTSPGTDPTPILPDRLAKRDLQALALGYLLFLLGLYAAQVMSSAQILGSERYFAIYFPGATIICVAGMLHWYHRTARYGAVLGLAALLLQAGITAGYYAGPGEGFREAIETIESDLPDGRGVVAIMSGGGETGLTSYYGQNINRPILYLNRYEKSPKRIWDLLGPYIAEHPEFWVMVYHEKRETIWKVLENPKHAIEPVIEVRELGKSKVGLFRYAQPHEEEFIPGDSMDSELSVG